MNTLRQSVSLVLLTFVVAVATVDLAQRWPSGAVTGAPLAEVPSSVANTHLDGYVSDTSVLVATQPVSAWVSSSQVVAEVDVVSVGTVRFNTPSGGIPTQDPAELIDPMAELSDTNGLQLVRPVALRARDVVKTDVMTATGYVIAQFGGSIPGSAGGYVHEQAPRMEFGVGQVGVAFLGTTEPLAVPWYDLLQDTADVLNNVPGQNYEVRVLRNWFLYNIGTATSTFEGTAYPISELLEAIDDALGGP